MHTVDTLDNGLQVVVKPMDHMESVSLGIWIRAGGRYENAKNNGMSHLLEHLLFKGTKNRNMKNLKEEIEGRGGSFNGFTAEEFTCYLVKVLAKDAELGVDILSDMVLRPRLDEEEIVKEKSVIIEEINMYKDIPSHHVHEILTEMLWPSQPLGFPLAGTVESVRSITRDDLVAYREAYYNPKNMLIVGSGRITKDAMTAMAGKYLAKAAGAVSQVFVKADSGQSAARLSVNFKETEQTHVALGLHAPNRFHPDRYVLSLLNIILGANMSSRLFHRVRDEMALCYEISSSTRLYDDAGVLVISAGVDDTKIMKAMEMVLGELGRMAHEPVGGDELRRAKEYYKGQLLFALEDTMSYMLWLGEKLITGEGEFSAAKILERVEGVKQGDILRVADAIFRDENLNLAVIGPIRQDKMLKDALHIS